jgi:hypothetical protein
MQNREELRQKGHDRSRKMTSRERGKKYHLQRGGGINIVFGPKYRPLPYILTRALAIRQYKTCYIWHSEQNLLLNNFEDFLTALSKLSR